MSTKRGGRGGAQPYGAGVGCALLALVLLLPAWAGAAPLRTGRRVAVVVGANAAMEGRSELRYAHLDAQRVAQVLTDVGEFRAQDVVLLLDPAPEAVLSALDTQLAALQGESGETLLLFYYSGHADSAALYPSGRALSLEQVRQRVDARKATARVGIIDACRGGGWTQAKGLQPEDKPFDVKVPLALRSEGSVLISSSSGLENAHEAEAFEGSFFTHHLVAGLRGAADQGEDGEVSVVEAFDYARGLTVRDTALLGATPQHPSFDLNLRGRSDLSLTRVGGAGSHLRLQQSAGPMRVLQAASGGQVAELPTGERSALLALPPGRYLVLQRGAQGTRAREVTLAAGQTVTLTEASLEAVQPSLLARKGDSPARNTLTLSVFPGGTGFFPAVIGIELEHALDPRFALAAAPHLDLMGGVGATL
ncbi:MAG TPA: caspase family protein, partial [Aggregicoccus sp.]|nr:caspase family protein [Aggregicoccus sp.]